MRAFRVAYDGRAYHGFQRQPDVPTVSGAILAALSDLGIAELGAVPPGYAAAGRTDAGVSALCQTIAFEAPAWLTPAALSAELPVDVRAWASADVAEGFHATHEAAARTYTYYMHAPAERSDDEAALEAAATCSGEHDVHNLTPDESGTVRTLDVGLERSGNVLVITATAGGFPRSLVRRLVGLLDEVATGDAGQDRVQRVLGDEEISGPEGVAAAPPEPLVLTDVSYPDVEFDVDPDAAESARAVFAARRIEHRTNARVAGHLADGLE